jgi:ATP-dependent exoDNAse (exonuclease V) alpha subunit
MAGTGKSTTLKKIKEHIKEGYVTGAFTHKAAKIVKGKTLHTLLGIDTKTNNIDYKLINSYVNSGVKHFLIDEISMVPSWMWNISSHIKQQHGFIFIGFGDWGQLPPVNEEDIDLVQTWIVKYMFNTRWFELVKPHRSTDLELNDDAKQLRDGKTIDFTRYGNIEHDLALCHTNDMVDAINKKWNDHYAKTKNQKLAVTGFDGTKYVIYAGLKVMAHKTHPEQVFTNSEELEKEKRGQTTP